ncbi:MAG: hypothetical protein A2W91_03065 [Bacteroidetes bacterium GWF2_38_335]|nr:MAG: hypothetical protein A2W91_03065 [Bacteroidetes bacterium GWF2_38_335]OFY77529.1 MAG: hypothetical protein A2281_01695 [Bacteroidetes bacterium RIFOXYA12_FULL_38_20]HBS87174.1 hypothetical protein [Bacteroidales bacterium]
MSPLVFILLTFSGWAEEKPFYEEFKYELNKAKNYYDGLSDSLKKKCDYYKSDFKILSAVIFPELIRYSSFRDFFETSALEAIYVEKGTSGANFSIGKFQMKPSFVENLEEYVREYPEELNKIRLICEYDHTEPKKIRKQRLERLKSESWQMTYLNCFYHIMKHRFGGKTFTDNEEKTRFYATAYNHGFKCSEDELKGWIPKKCFPDGCKCQERTQYCYSDISVYFYRFLKKKEDAK